MKRPDLLLIVIGLLWVGQVDVYAQWDVGPPPDRDFFTAHEDGEAQRDLVLNDLYHTNRVVHSIKVGRYDEAIADLRFVLDKWTNHPRALLLMENLARVTQAPGLPIPYYEKAVRIYPQYGMTFAQFGKYEVEIGEIDKGIGHLKQAVQKDPKLKAARVWLAEAYDKQGHRELARIEAEEARKLGFTGDFQTDIEMSSKSAKSK